MEAKQGMTLKEMSDFFWVPYEDIITATKTIRASQPDRKRNEKYNLEDVRAALIKLIEKRIDRADADLEYYMALKRDVELAGVVEDCR